MTDRDVQDDPNTPVAPQESWASRHPKMSILLIAAVFYVILFSMCGFVLVLLLRG